MKLAHFSDLHYCQEHLDEVDRCFSFGIERAIAEFCECAVISGDLFDHRVEVHQPVVSRLLAAVAALAEHMPVMILQGTFSHDQPGSLDIFRTIGGRYPVHVADRIQQVYLMKNPVDDDITWESSESWYFDIELGTELNAMALFSCLPPVNKATLAAGNVQDAGQAAGDYVYQLMRGWSVINRKTCAAGIPTIVVSHGTVNGCTTEQGVPMHGHDHEFTTGALFAAEASAVMVGHIHQYQVWRSDDGRLIAYPGSIGRLHFGELTDKGFLIWNVAHDGADCEFVVTPAKKLLQIEFDGPPDMAELQRLALDAGDAHVRIRYTVDEEHRAGVDKAAIEALFAGAGACKIEGRIKPVQRQRAAGITQAVNLQDKLKSWINATAQDARITGELSQRLAMLQSMSPEAVAEFIIKESSSGHIRNNQRVSR